MKQSVTEQLSMHDIPLEVVERLLNHHHMSWVALSSPYRIQEDTSPIFRQPDFSLWIQME